MENDPGSASASYGGMPHPTARALAEVGVVTGLFLLAIGCMACALHRRPRNGGGDRCCRRILRRGSSASGRLFGDGGDNDDDGESYIDDEETGRAPSPHVFDTLHELVFFLGRAGDGGGGRPPPTGIVAGSGEAEGRRVPAGLDRIFPDLLEAPGGAGGGDPQAPGGAEGGNGLREPLL
ncbi:unnamed protein product [Pseudo-nitzschia multistriata]|uniref:Uncharacterized protein n=1 Tax=Pseudo-nitzschia multistriata TaxID=183589 RepID=A0A448YVH1_9STRA|nr:unnamed protein product [Pseudo-nitzschia multistriata]